MSFRVEKLAPTLGARVTGVDLSSDLDATTVGMIETALSEHGVLAFPGQLMNDGAHARFAGYFGELQTFAPASTEDKHVRAIYRSANVQIDGSMMSSDHESNRLLKLNWLWHADSTYRRLPNKGTVLRVAECASRGGDTVFANMTASYEALPRSMRDSISSLDARHSFEFMVSTQGLAPLGREELSGFVPVEHPLVRQHAGGKQSLFLSPPYMENIVGWDRAESRTLVQELLEWATQPRFLYQHRWRAGDVVMWDNGWTMHKVTPFDVEKTRRVMYGAVLLGNGPVEPINVLG